MFQELQRFWRDESGPELIEWAAVVVILLLATIVILGAIGRQLTDIYNKILELLQTYVLTEPAQPGGGG